MSRRSGLIRCSACPRTGYCRSPRIWRHPPRPMAGRKSDARLTQSIRASKISASKSVGPGLAAAERKIVGIGDLTVGRGLRLDHLVRNALALAIGDRVFLGVEADGELLLHVARGGPAHQGLDRPRLFRLIVELPCFAIRLARLHRVLGRLEDARSHGWSVPVKMAGCSVWRKPPG